MEKISAWMADVLAHASDAQVIQRVRSEVAELAAGFPLYARRLEAADAVQQRLHATRANP
jgi:hypothetical protein